MSYENRILENGVCIDAMTLTREQAIRLQAFLSSLGRDASLTEPQAETMQHVSVRFYFGLFSQEGTTVNFTCSTTATDDEIIEAARLKLDPKYGGQKNLRVEILNKQAINPA